MKQKNDHREHEDMGDTSGRLSASGMDAEDTALSLSLVPTSDLTVDLDADALLLAAEAGVDPDKPDYRQFSALSGQKKRRWEAQERFLRAYGKGGDIETGLVAAGVTRRCMEFWRQLDAYNFRQRMEWARQRYCDSLEAKAQELIEGLKPGQNTLILITRLNAERPEKYRPNQQAQDDTAREILVELKRIARERRAPGGSMGPPVVVDQDNGGVMHEVDGILRRKQGQG